VPTDDAGVLLSSPPSERADTELDRLLRNGHARLGNAGSRVVRFIDENREITLASSAAALGDLTRTSDATVVRTIQALGFAGLSDLKRAILEAVGQETSPASDMRRTLKELQKTTGHAVESVLRAHIEGIEVVRSRQCATQIAAAVGVLGSAERIVIFGIGPSASLAAYVSMLLGRCGRQSRALNVTGSMLADQLLDLKRSDALLVLAYGRLYKEVAAVFGEAKALGLQSVLVTEATGTPLAKLADVVVAIPRGRPGHVALHGATLVGLEALVLSLAAARPDASMSSLDNLNHLRAVIEGRRNVRS
jgi:DNA-binding MurR/RpiR family transcriptional regulator